MDRFTWKGHCMYCGHCAPCPMSIDIANVNKFLNLAKAEGGVPETVGSHYSILDHHASECIECGACESRCPFGVPIINRMKEAVAMFGK
jgi:predicted aldo/keto reductase-like oxidoreductase